MAIRVSSTEKKAEIARDVVVAYLSNAGEQQLADLDKVGEAIQRLVDVVDHAFDVPDRAPAGFGITPTIPSTATQR
jgi:hypothetical protein